MAEGELFRATVICQLADLTAIVFDFGFADKAVGATHIDTGVAAGDFQTLAQSPLANGLPDDLTFKRYRFACVAGTHVGEIGYVEVAPPVVGQLTSNGRMPNEMAISIKRNTGRASRRDRGRIFYGPVAVSNVMNTDYNRVSDDGPLADVANLLRANLITQTRTLNPVILAANGTTTGYTIQNVAIGEVLVHRKSRRPRVGS